MTPIVLLDALEEFIKDKTKDIILEVKQPKINTEDDDEVSTESTPITHRAADVYQMRLPDKESETSQVPYILLQILTGKDTQELGQTTESECKVRLVFGTYSADGQKGSLDVLNLLTRVRIELLESGIVGDQFILKKPLEYMVYPDSTAPYYFGEMMTTWEVPPVERKVDFNG